MAKKDRCIVLVTGSYPYGTGEPFLEEELRFYAETSIRRIVVVPLLATGKRRPVPAGIEVDTGVAEMLQRKRRYRLIYALKTWLTLRPLNEWFGHMLRTKQLFSSLAQYGMYRAAFHTWMRQMHPSALLFYTYWHTEAAYAIGSLRRKGRDRLVSRIHGYDLYEHRRPVSYMPLKRHFCTQIDRLYTLSASASEYVVQTYGCHRDRIRIARLGVRNRGVVSVASAKEALHIASCSLIVPIKQVEKIVESIESLASMREDMPIVWYHIGDGPMRTFVEEKARDMLDGYRNVSYHFLGEMDNEEVYAFYAAHTVDVFLNVSASEGAPVSIMEAMSCQIPILAPDIGGISEMVSDGENGRLLSSNCSVFDVAKRLADTQFWKARKTREASYTTFLKCYDARKNYAEFLRSIEELL